MNVVLIACVDKFFFSSRRRHTRLQGDWSSDVCSSDLTDSVDLSEVLAQHFEKERSGIEGEDIFANVFDSPRLRDVLSEIGRASCREGACTPEELDGWMNHAIRLQRLYERAKKEGTGQG